jgi:carotenoid cleavage dioxygenase
MRGRGRDPPELEGAYYRTGADRQFPSLEDDIILNGDGMASDVPLRERPRQLPQPLRPDRAPHARARGARRLYGHYRNKYTDDDSVSNLPQRDNTGNTNAFNHHGELYMLREDSHPYRVDPETLETVEVGRSATSAAAR